MARRSRKSDLNGIVGLAVIAAFWLIGKFLERLPEDSGTVAVRAIFGLGTLTIIYLMTRSFAERMRSARALQALLRKADYVTQQHLMSLVRRRRS